MLRKRSIKFWIAFWLISALFLVGWFLFWRIKHLGPEGLISFLRPIMGIVPMNEQKKEELSLVFDVIDNIVENGEKTFLILFQNNHELRPGGGYIGSFGILKIKDGKVTLVDTHDTNVFDSGGDTNAPLPFPMKKMLQIPDWELRDSNWSADFPINAAKAEEFYHLEGGQEELDGVVAISTEVLASFLEVTGPISVAGYPGEYTSENAIEKLQYQVEQGYWQQDIEKGKRKYVMKELSREIMKRVQSLGIFDKKRLAEKIEMHLERKDVLLNFKEADLADKVRALNWGGEIRTAEGDFLMLVDANLGAYKTDAVLKRSFEYTVDFRHERPWVKLVVKYDLTGQEKDWRTSDYNGYLRVFAPEGSWLYDVSGVGETRFGNELGKKYFGFIHQTKLGQTHSIEVAYDLPENIIEEDYSLLIQKQSGIVQMPGNVMIIRRDGSVFEEEFDLTEDREIMLK